VTEYYEPVFIAGPKDGAEVPMPLWVLDKIELIQRLQDGRNVIYLYKLDNETKNYIYEGQRDEDEEMDC
jgi:hypothetical protein